MTTLNNALNYFQQIASSHRQINSYDEGDIWDIVTSGDIAYPLLHVSLNDVLVGKRVESLNFTFTIMDIVKGGRVNEQEVSSDMLEIGKDIVALLQDPSYPFQYSEDQIVDFKSFTEKFSDSVTGYTFDVELLLPFAFDRCQIPYTPTSIIVRDASSPTGFLTLQKLTLVSGTANGVNTVFVFDASPLLVYNSGALKLVGTGYNQSTTTITFTGTDIPFTDDLIWAYGYK